MPRHLAEIDAAPSKRQSRCDCKFQSTACILVCSYRFIICAYEQLVIGKEKYSYVITSIESQTSMVEGYSSRFAHAYRAPWPGHALASLAGETVFTGDTGKTQIIETLTWSRRKLGIFRSGNKKTRAIGHIKIMHYRIVFREAKVKERTMHVGNLPCGFPS